MTDWGKCDQYEKPAINLARDIYVKTEPTDIWERYEPGKKLKRGCEDHSPRSLTIDRDGIVLETG